MHAKSALFACLLTALTAGDASAAEASTPGTAKDRRFYPPMIDGARVETYKRVAGVDLKLWWFEPALDSKTPRAAIVFFFGGGWQSGSPAQFVPQARYLTNRGMVAMVADYRVGSRNKVKPVACVADAKSCLRWIRLNAARLGIDPNRIAAGGGSAGGHLAAALGTVPGLDEPGEDKTVSVIPNALVLFNPALVLAPWRNVKLEEFDMRLTAERFGIEPQALSPIHHVRPGAPPTIIFHGKADKTVPYATVEAFAKAMKEAGNRCELVGYEGQSHGFFNANRGENRFYRETLMAADKFLVSLGYLQSEPGKN